MKSKKPKRRIKKSVKRGCLGILLALLAIVAFTVYRCTSSHADDADAIVVLEPDSLDLAVASRIESLVESERLIDTARLGISVFDLERNCIVYDRHGHRPMVPASCMKLLTAIRAMHCLGIDHEYKSGVYIGGVVEDGVLHGDVLFQMDDDPMLDSLQPFVHALTERGIRSVDGRVYLDLALADTMRQHPTAKPWDMPYRKLPLLLKGAGHVVRQLTEALRAADVACSTHINLLSEAEAVGDDLTGEMELIYEKPTPMREVIAPMLIHSSNIKAEGVYHHTALHDVKPLPGEETTAVAETGPFSFIHQEMCYADTEGFVLNDGSGLSPENRLSSDFLVQLMAYAYRRDDMRPILIYEALATPGHPLRHGSLLGRMRGEPCEGRIFCKTGTLSEEAVSSLTGYAQHTDGRWFAFSILGENCSVLDSRVFQDKLCKALVQGK